ncbi:hypothetical protein M2451_002704 [Dysgonomonas sp. PFB1-18]|uniref:hypothetical protein n=1 Tax=unclassified Dysgonomonas TaxID=2630389 RepID=UPI0024747EE7|nr:MULTISPECIES: hypothetical protein [unclassified Dysgonomonas]MDH6309410.1 hypothetical protein [Dysgonomonas sp. PF1-14]MDH6339725.1 hypothetical protein [Dysgonomonas sp. PF1-16]MDH6381373.1 hypothetical protein [Dysgonomonas sp. PFB1-18]MDH6398588.1 hypothetical protein [Dysgonomonas sp. PF1-23]
MANKNKGILIGDDGNLLIEVTRDAQGKITDGLVIGDVTSQNQNTILLAEKGEIKNSPLLGVGIASYLDDESPSELLREVRINLRMDGQKVRSCGFDNNGKLIIQGGYED